ncbi:MAG TPA: glyceraldehyde 3-phosphate dehydrogenase NAD-binding domain-containing protein [Candidatus Limnocylindria bacterium]|nr:glyceraldehyde 3-phosphate dehydrogenase NAD-binding domain-containing protein [Candidatus Limnocylindria bacterium]
MLRIAINGFGRIGRNFLRTLLQDAEVKHKITIAVINIGPAKLSMIAHMFKYDTLMGTYPGAVTLDGDHLVVDNYRIKIITAVDPSTIDWKAYSIDWVVEASGKFTQREGASKHLKAGARYVLITAPAQDEDVTIIPGVNDAAFDPQTHKIISLGSCTTNAFLPTLKVVHDAFTIQQCFMTTVHSYTNSQVLLDVEAKDERRSRAAALNIIPSTTGAMKVMGKVIPELIGCVEAVALRVPVAKVSLIDVTFMVKKEVTVPLLYQVFEQAAQGDLQGILGITMEPLVSSDFGGDARSVIIDGKLTSTCGKTMGKIFGWYDNEWGYSCRLRDFLMEVASY